MFTIGNDFFANMALMRKNLDAQLANYLRKRRGILSYAKFAKATGISQTMLHRLEMRERHITLNKLETLMCRLKINLSDIFPNEF